MGIGVAHTCVNKKTVLLLQQSEQVLVPVQLAARAPPVLECERQRIPLPRPVVRRIAGWLHRGDAMRRHHVSGCVESEEVPAQVKVASLHAIPHAYVTRYTTRYPFSFTRWHMK